MAWKDSTTAGRRSTATSVAFKPFKRPTGSYTGLLAFWCKFLHFLLKHVLLQGWGIEEESCFQESGHHISNTLYLAGCNHSQVQMMRLVMHTHSLMVLGLDDCCSFICLSGHVPSSIITLSTTKIHVQAPLLHSREDETRNSLASDAFITQEEPKEILQLPSAIHISHHQGQLLLDADILGLICYDREELVLLDVGHNLGSQPLCCALNQVIQTLISMWHYWTECSCRMASPASHLKSSSACKLPEWTSSIILVLSPLDHRAQCSVWHTVAQFSRCWQAWLCSLRPAVLGHCPAARWLVQSGWPWSVQRPHHRSQHLYEPLKTFHVHWVWTLLMSICSVEISWADPASVHSARSSRFTKHHTAVTQSSI